MQVFNAGIVGSALPKTVWFSDAICCDPSRVSVEGLLMHSPEGPTLKKISSDWKRPVSLSGDWPFSFHQYLNVTASGLG
jgi:hypothetical protein